ncbi:PhoPQ-activated pathogenicity-related family protein [Calycomorphotria hydatis]|uniref:PhoPQ-activated pathogenicity-related protein n=1 Tax=Calycomorphotria hydatis TaxID=2528027 RepID=A0A517TA62_9PLAN|nr:PhoPQ-activated protein PqaA family protein [Calycomorphotria hydatis]QDT65253.1 PhoPQ-activated pathogenicity-related protein [Calycomorphotria hydatis]
MKILVMLLNLFVLLSGIAIGNEAVSPPSELQDYVNKPEDVFKWEMVEKSAGLLGTTWQLSLDSQQWQGHTWTHMLEVFESRGCTQRSKVLLLVVGGRTGKSPKYDRSIGLALSLACNAPVAVVHQVPNQPLLGEWVEDDLIAETWLKYLETGDQNWPLLFPMVKSAVKAMDAVQEFSLSIWKQEVEGFVITGASKRGWTSWLTAAIDDRVIATAPIVIDMLNLSVQMDHQLDCWDDFSPSINAYTSRGLVSKPDGRPEQPKTIKLKQMMDPYTYRKNIEIPKLIVVGTNDPFWVVDSANLYWDGLVGPKYIRQVPNAGHSLKEGKLEAIQTVAMFVRQIIANETLPSLKWNYEDQDGEVALTMSSDPLPLSVKLWKATSPKRDFRNAKWTSEKVALIDAEYRAKAPTPDTGHIAVYGEFQFARMGIPYSLTTLVFVR